MWKVKMNLSMHRNLFNGMEKRARASKHGNDIRTSADIFHCKWGSKPATTRYSFQLCSSEGSARFTRNLLEWIYIFLVSWDFTIPSNMSDTSFIDGRNCGSSQRQGTAIKAILEASLGGYFPSNLGSIICFSWLLSDSFGLIHFTRLCCAGGRFISITRRPVSISTKTTPKLYTSLFMYSFPDIR